MLADKPGSSYERCFSHGLMAYKEDREGKIKEPMLRGQALP